MAAKLKQYNLEHDQNKSTLINTKQALQILARSHEWFRQRRLAGEILPAFVYGRSNMYYDGDIVKLRAKYQQSYMDFALNGSVVQQSKQS